MANHLGNITIYALHVEGLEHHGGVQRVARYCRGALWWLSEPRIPHISARVVRRSGVAVRRRQTSKPLPYTPNRRHTVAMKAMASSSTKNAQTGAMACVL